MEEVKPPKPLSVAELNQRIRKTLEGTIGVVDVEGELSGWKVYPSGHAYFILKDAEAQISCAMFGPLLFACPDRQRFKDGAKVKIRGQVTLYPQRGTCQLVVRRMKIVGEGDLMQQYLALKAKLEAEGLFAAAHKKPLPYLPHRIGIITSEAGAVIHDMVRVITRRFPAIEIRLWPCQVQGDGVVGSVMEGLGYFAADKPDLVIIARGGGSFEDLFPFNDERLVRAVAAYPLPTIAAIGHESDFSLIEFAADQRAGTPSIAAEMAVREYDELMSTLENCRARLSAALRGRSENTAQHLDLLAERLGSMLTRYGDKLAHRLMQLSGRMDAPLRLSEERAKARLEKAKAALEHLSPYKVLDRGYALVGTSEGSVVKRAADLHCGSQVYVRLAKGGFASVVKEIYP